MTNIAGYELLLVLPIFEIFIDDDKEDDLETDSR